MYMLQLIFFSFQLTFVLCLFQGDSLVLHCASLTVHNKMAAVKKSMWNNIIKMKLTEEKRYRNFCSWLFLAEVRLNVLGMCVT